MSKVTRNHWFGLGARFCYAKDDYLIIVLRFGWWQLWLEWETPEKRSEGK